jgi:hypothetical protein
MSELCDSSSTTIAMTFTFSEAVAYQTGTDRGIPPQKFLCLFEILISLIPLAKS